MTNPVFCTGFTLSGCCEMLIETTQLFTLNKKKKVDFYWQYFNFELNFNTNKKNTTMLSAGMNGFLQSECAVAPAPRCRSRSLPSLPHNGNTTLASSTTSFSNDTQTREVHAKLLSGFIHSTFMLVRVVHIVTSSYNSFILVSFI